MRIILNTFLHFFHQLKHLLWRETSHGMRYSLGCVFRWHSVTIFAFIFKSLCFHRVWLWYLMSLYGWALCLHLRCWPLSVWVFSEWHRLSLHLRPRHMMSKRTLLLLRLHLILTTTPTTSRVRLD